ncbi:DUF3298 and DUF4163 domain-containing protein [Paenibacillus sp. ACRRX]|uniref:DUF3298 and DUF4163 domain-containing protein n=1 Tax=unclassified Paenibacillus TaxID=185978 RepID=UPI001EF716E7|nr:MULTISPECIES: DUF3298 and DUF4163 domain-containing protein [unclassified Paenibacillus]MCG7407126.1 DUF3298 and DUF4163 domain-containing protein [Paenibacillus sp. ACRRX]MDK8180346.1 DUF3298 domain-containing protein [Paenibacillus sp. UMB4589-SE434]
MATTLYPLPVPIVPHKINKPKLEVYVPQILNAQAPLAAKTINQMIHQTVIELIRMTGYEENEQTEVMGSFEIKLNERGLLSLTLTVYGYPQGAAHGMTYQRGLTFDVNTGKLYMLSDLFKPSAPYVELLSANVSRQIKQRDIPTLEPFTKIRPDQDFYMTDKALVLFFGLYELAAYVYGFLYFPISIYDLNDIKAENGVIDTLWY